jgi:nucleoside phosphorylase
MTTIPNVLGEIGRHNVVIAALPKGEYGISSATGVLRDMLHTFYNLKIVLMVGIGGGVPNTYKVRLGDIVVASPTKEGSGVYQYDYGKTIHARTFIPTMTMSKTPLVFRTAISQLEVEYAVDGHGIPGKIEAVLEKYSRLKKVHKRPALSMDKLYRADVVHPPDEPKCQKCGKEPQCEKCGDQSKCDECGDEATCEKCKMEPLCGKCGNDSKNLVSRPERDEDDIITVHYGLIASGNQLMKDASIRDKLSKEKDVLCFEMEAAGLMNQFPCLVVRGICDYSDSHKNKVWQGHAAMAAAAYAKDLLNLMVPSRIEVEKKIADIVSESR